MNANAIIALAAFIPCLASAGEPIPADFTINWFSIDGGGGTSSSAGGEFSVSGTVGQTDPATAASGPFSLQGGFWGLYGVIQTPGAPLLTIERLPNGDLRVAWPLPAPGWVLDESATLGQAPAPWTLVPEASYQT
ncbi:MAG: hypothetical protein O3A92_13775, partial [Verrucomicrobia bacterium]|nr:hypothetical protein [Verrucomicrobiota bacterium]